MPISLSKLTLRGFKSFKNIDGFEPQQINILIGANGAGKSNFLSFFRMLSWIMAGNLQEFLATYGRASRVLHDGPKATPSLEAKLEIQTDGGLNNYEFCLAYGADDTLFFKEERYCFLPSPAPISDPHWTSLGSGHSEAKLLERADIPGKKTPATIRNLLQRLVVHQFHDTSSRSRIRGSWESGDNWRLKEDGANLGAFLLGLRESGDLDAQIAYQRIESTLRRVAPFFDRFLLEPHGGQVLLQWLEKGTDTVFSAFQASDGLLRTMALIALLSQPKERLPSVLFLDEPELGLHPYAIHILAALLKQVSHSTQIFVATQSPLLLDEFEPEQVVVVTRQGRESLLNRKTAEELAEWREEYSLGDLWRKNLLGGGPIA